ncbi:hypothetical protein [Foetidibacter luteolus]|uniref:hypothetical protein n=1 Tax=Foetidibacter luteolus TaxID=2608880 RepID=UPI00129B64C5|nr:hypothetical protein [Foetidibacter luteolus]
MYRFKMFRDRIELNQQLRDFIAETLSRDNASTYAGRKLLLAAREITITPNFTFELDDCDITFVADYFNTRDGKIKLNVTQSVADNLPGLPGRNITILTKKWEVGSGFLLKGGKGGKGLRGATGTKGADGTYSATNNNGKDGGKGGKGKTGATGGKGGNLSVLYVEKSPRGIIMPELMVPGGDGGTGGPGGYGGEGGAGVEWCKPGGTYCVDGKDGKTGPVGDPGNTGAQGPAGTYTASKINTAFNYGMLLQLLSVPVTEWAAYRLKVGEYFYRAFSAQNHQYHTLALGEFDAALAMNPQLSQAATYRNQFLNNQNILGIPRYVDIIPDFAKYEQVYTSYYPIVGPVFQAASKMLMEVVSLNNAKADLQREINNAAGMVNVLTDERNAALVAKDIADKEYIRAQQRVVEITDKINARKEELENADVDILGAIIGTVALVASLVAAIPSMGTSLVGAATAIGVMASTVNGVGVGSIIEQATNPDLPQTELDKLKKEAQGLKGFVEKASQGLDTIISFPSMLDELWNANIDDAEYKKLIAESIQLVHEELIAKLGVGESAYLVQAAEKRLQLAKDNKAAAELQLAGLTTDTSKLESAAHNLIKMSQHYMTTLGKYAFFAARALEIYTLADKSTSIRFDYGFIHPDKEADYKMGLLRLSALITMYQQSWSQFANIITYKEQYDNYFNTGNWVNDYHRISITDSAALAEFRNTKKLNLNIRLADLPPTRYEAKVDSVYIAFIGATSVSGTVTTIVEHAGSFQQKKRNGTLYQANLNPRSGVALAKTTPLQSNGGIPGNAGSEADFRGRGLAAHWHLTVEQSEIQTGNVNFNNLTEIQVWFGYESFLVSQAASQLVKDGLLIEDASSGKTYVTYGGAKLLIPGKESLPSLGLTAAVVDSDTNKDYAAALTTIPRDRTLLRSKQSGKMYMVSKGLKLEINNEAALDKLGYDSAEAKLVPESALELLPYGGTAN